MAQVLKPHVNLVSATEASKNLGHNVAYALWIIGSFMLATTCPTIYMCSFVFYAFSHYYLVEGSTPDVRLNESMIGPNIIILVVDLVLELFSEIPVIGRLCKFINNNLLSKPAMQLLDRSESVIPSLLHVVIIALVFYFFGVPAIVQNTFAFIGFPNLLPAMGSSLIGIFFIAQHTQNLLETILYLLTSLIDCITATFGFTLFSRTWEENKANVNFGKSALWEEIPNTRKDIEQGHSLLPVSATRSNIHNFLNFFILGKVVVNTVSHCVSPSTPVATALSPK